MTFSFVQRIWEMAVMLCSDLMYINIKMIFTLGFVNAMISCGLWTGT